MAQPAEAQAGRPGQAEGLEQAARARPPGERVDSVGGSPGGHFDGPRGARAVDTERGRERNMKTKAGLFINGASWLLSILRTSPEAEDIILRFDRDPRKACEELPVDMLEACSKHPGLNLESVEADMPADLIMDHAGGTIRIQLESRQLNGRLFVNLKTGLAAWETGPRVPRDGVKEGEQIYDSTPAMPEAHRKRGEARLAQATETPAPPTSSPKSGMHEHPHKESGAHGHIGLANAGPGAHSHSDESQGAHSHSPNDPPEGQHTGVDGVCKGIHDHLQALGMGDYIRWAAEQHFPVHKWLPGHTGTLIREAGTFNFRPDSYDDWTKHVQWGTHSTGEVRPCAHIGTMVEPSTRLMEVLYRFEDGSMRQPTAEDFEAEHAWFEQNTPPELRMRMAEAGAIEFADRYSAMGIPRPDPETVCQGPCEGTGYVPVCMRGSVLAEIPMPESGLHPLTVVKDCDCSHCTEQRAKRAQEASGPAEKDPALVGLWMRAEAAIPSPDGWHFVVCPSCNGTGLRPGEAHIPPHAVGEAAYKGIWGWADTGHGNSLDGIRIAQRLSRRLPMSITSLKIIKAYHDLQAESPAPMVGPDNIAFLLFGGTPGKEWASAVLQAAGVKEAAPKSAGITETQAKAMSMANLYVEHRRLHERWDGLVVDPLESRDQLVTQHELVVSETVARGGQHASGGIVSALDRLTLERRATGILGESFQRVLGSPLMRHGVALAAIGGRAIGQSGDDDLVIWVNLPEAFAGLEGQITGSIREALAPGMTVKFVHGDPGPVPIFLPIAGLELKLRPQPHLKPTIAGLEESLRQQATESATQNQVEPFRWAHPAPWVYAHPLGAFGSEERQREALRAIPASSYPLIVQPLPEGVRMRIDKRGAAILVTQDDGRPCEARDLGRFTAQIAKMRDDFVVVGALAESETGPRFVADDILWLNGKDIHGSPAIERLQALDGIRETRDFRSTTWVINARPDDPQNEMVIRAAANRMGSCGWQTKGASSACAITGASAQGSTRYLNEGQIVAQVVGRRPAVVAGAEDPHWVYNAAIPSIFGSIIPLGETMPTQVQVQEGGLIRVRVDGLARLVAKAGGAQPPWYEWARPRVIASAIGSASSPEDLAELHERLGAKVEERQAMAIVVTEGQRSPVRASYTRAEAAARGKRFTEEDFSKEAIGYDIGAFQITHHWTRPGVHKDFRFKTGAGVLHGWTISEDEAAVPVLATVQEAYEWQAKMPWRFRPDAGEPVAAFPKAQHPTKWLNAWDISYPEDHMGESAEEAGVYTLVDEGRLRPGKMTPEMREYFLEGDIFRGRMVFTRKTFEGGVRQWMAEANPAQKLPAILIEDDAYAPDNGISALPPAWEAHIREDHRWWDHNVGLAERMIRLDAARKDLRARGLLPEAFCPTGKGGGQDNTCSSNDGGKGDAAQADGWEPKTWRDEKGGEHQMFQRVEKGSTVDGREVADEVPNQGSIESSLNEYTVLPGIREVPMEAFTQLGALKYYSASEKDRTQDLAGKIKQSGKIAPLIVVLDKEGPYVLEGGHRFDALRELGAKSFPAMVVTDDESIRQLESEPPRKTSKEAFCPTGRGGGQDNTCSSRDSSKDPAGAGKSTGRDSSRDYASEDEAVKAGGNMDAGNSDYHVWKGVRDGEWADWADDPEPFKMGLEGKTATMIRGDKIDKERAAEIKDATERIQRAAQENVVDFRNLVRGESYATEEEFRARYKYGSKQPNETLTSVTEDSEIAKTYATTQEEYPVRVIVEYGNPNGIRGVQTAPMGVPSNEIVLPKGDTYRVAQILNPDNPRYPGFWVVQKYSTDRHADLKDKPLHKPKSKYDHARY